MVKVIKRPQVKINKMTQEQFQRAELDAGELYAVIDAPATSWGEIGGDIEDQEDLVEYIDENGGKIDTIKVNGVEQTITNKTVDIAVPTKTSDLENDSNFQTDTDVATLISTHNSSTTAHNDIRQAISALDDITVSTIQKTTTNFVPGTTYSITNAVQRTANLFEGYKQDLIDPITAKIPTEATSTNKLADKAFVNSSIQASAADFCGNFDTWANVPTQASGYLTTPGTNDYMIVTDAKNYAPLYSNQKTYSVNDEVTYNNALYKCNTAITTPEEFTAEHWTSISTSSYTGSWRFKYTGVWEIYGKNGWNAEYRVGNAFTAAQLAALNSGITSTMVDDYVNPTSTADTAYNSRITSVETDKRDNIYESSKIYGTSSTGTQVSYSAGKNISFANNTISATTKTFAITEDIVTVTRTEEQGVSPYSSSYKYTNIEINADAGIEWIEGALYTFMISSSMVVASAYRNVRIRIGSTGDWKPLMGPSSTIASGSTYFTKAYSTIYQYKTTYQANGGLHVLTDNNTTYEQLRNVIPTGAVQIDDAGYGARYSLIFPTTALNVTDERFSSLVASSSTATTKTALTALTFYADRNPQYVYSANISAGEASDNATYQYYTTFDLRYTANTSSTYVGTKDKVFLWLKDFNPANMSFKADATVGNVFSLNKIATRFPSSTTGDVYIYFIGWSAATWYTTYPNITQDNKIFKYTPSTGAMVEFVIDELDKKQDELSAGTGIGITSNTVSVDDNVFRNVGTGQGSWIEHKCDASQTLTTPNTTILGVGATCPYGLTVAVGTSAKCTDNYSVSVGANSESKKQSVAVGEETEAKSECSVATGYKAKANYNYSVSIGYNANVTGNNATAIGSSANATATGTAVGVATEAGTFGFAAGYFSQAYTRDVAIGMQAKAFGNYNIAIGDNAKSTGSYCTAMGYYATVDANPDCAIAIGKNAYASGNLSIAIGSSPTWSTDYAARATGYESVAIGALAHSLANYSIQIGSGTNNESQTLQFRNWSTMNLSSGKIYEERLPYGVQYATDVPYNLYNVDEGKMYAIMYTGETNVAYTQKQNYVSKNLWGNSTSWCSWVNTDFAQSEDKVMVNQAVLYQKMVNWGYSGGSNSEQDLYFYYDADNDSWRVVLDQDTVEEHSSGQELTDIDLADFGIVYHGSLPTEGEEEMFDVAYYAPFYFDNYDYGSDSFTLNYPRFMSEMQDGDWGFGDIEKEGVYYPNISDEGSTIRFEYDSGGPGTWHEYINGEDIGYEWETPEMAAHFGITIEDGTELDIEYIEITMYPSTRKYWIASDPVPEGVYATQTQLTNAVDTLNNKIFPCTYVQYAGDLNNYTTDGIYIIPHRWQAYSTSSNFPDSCTSAILIVRTENEDTTNPSNTRRTQIIWIKAMNNGFTSPIQYTRNFNISWQPWQKILDTNSIKTISGYSASTAQTLTHDASGNLKWENS